MHFAKDLKFQRYIARKIGSKSINFEDQGLESRKINSRKNLHCIQ